MLIWTKVCEPSQPFLLDSCWDSEEEYQGWKRKESNKSWDQERCKNWWSKPTSLLVSWLLYTIQKETEYKPVKFIRTLEGNRELKVSSFFFFKVHSGTVKAFHISVNRTFDHNFTGGNVKLQALVLGSLDPWYQSFTDFTKHYPGSQQSIFLFHPQDPKVPLAIPSPGRCINICWSHDFYFLSLWWIFDIQLRPELAITKTALKHFILLPRPLKC